MKKRLLIGIMMLCSIILAGCVNADVTVDLEKDGTGKAIVEVLGPQTIFDNIPQNTIDEWGKSFEKVEKISDTDKTGYKFTTRQGPIDEVLKEVTDLNETIDKNGTSDAQDLQQDKSKQTDKQIDAEYAKVSENGSEQVVSVSNTEKSADNLANQLYAKYVNVGEEKGLFSSTYNIDLKLKNAIYSEMTDEQKALVSFIGRSANIGLHIKAPIKAESSNATSESKENGKYVYNWQYTLADVENIKFSAKIPNIRNIIIAAIGALVVLIVLIRLLFRKRK